ncbi:hypothetical protein GS979_06935 [Rhodococcus hoagii]|nr:hypothetical protein [Prescottella equi]NKW46146.1 hypothetical protein [Prescottella equi]
MVLPIPSGLRTGVVVALTGAALVLGSAVAGAEPASLSFPRGSLVNVNDVLGPASGTPMSAEPVY